jgi:hypothetical protein
VYPSQNTTYYLDLYAKNNGGMTTHELPFNVNQPKQIGNGTKEIAFDKKDSLVLTYDDLNLPRCFYKCLLTNKNTSHQIKIYQSANSLDSIVVIRDSLLRNFSDFSIALSSVTCDDVNWKIILNAAPVGISAIVASNWENKPVIGPNPFVSFLKVIQASNNAYFSLFDLNGKLIGNYNQKELEAADFSGFKTGLYVMQVIEPKGITHLKLVKE